MKPLFCPKCGSEDIDVLSSGLWDGEDENGNHIHGTHAIGECRNCGGRIAQQDDCPPHIPSDGEWEAHSEPVLKHRAELAKWPFGDEEDFNPE